MNRRIVAVWVSLILLLSFMVIIIDDVPPAQAAIITVDDDGPADYQKIQDAINASSDGDTIQVKNGVYYEHVVVNKTINLTGEDKNSTIIEGGASGNVVYMIADWVNMTGFTILNGGTGIFLEYSNYSAIEGNKFINNSGEGILLDGALNISIENNNFVNNLEGITIFDSSHIYITNNNFSNNEYGIDLQNSGYINVINNNITTKYYGIWVMNTYPLDVVDNYVSSGWNGLDLCYVLSGTILNNTIMNCEYGIILWSQTEIKNLANNSVYNCDYGIAVYGCAKYSNISGNIVSNNSYGIHLEDTYGNVIARNNISFSNSYGIYLKESSNNSITHNNLTENIRSVYLSDSNDNDIIGNTFVKKVNKGTDMGIFTISSNRNNISANIVTEFEYGIYIKSSYGNNVFDNSLNNNFNAIQLSYTIQSSLHNNSMIENGIQISGNLLEHWNTHTIDLTNTVNSKPVYYWKNQTGGVIPLDAGQVILANCSYVEIANLTLTYGSLGIELGFSSNNTVSQNNASNNKWYGIHLLHSNDNIIGHNNVKESDGGIILQLSDGNEIDSNNFSYGKGGVYLWDSSENNITNNTAIDVRSGIQAHSSSDKNRINGNDIILNETTSYYGIRIWDSNEANITDNKITLNQSYGIYIDNSDLTNIARNNITLNGEYGIYLTYSDKINISHNILTSKGGYGITLSNCRRINITNNSMYEFGIAIFAGSQEYWDTHTIDTSNSVNGKPVYYWKHQEGGTVPGGAGQVILVRCSGVTVEGQELLNTTLGIQLGFSPQNNITNNHIYNTIYGIYLWSSYRNYIFDNNISSNKRHGIYNLHSDYTNIDDNIIWSNKEDGIFIFYSWFNDITNNNISFNIKRGIYITWPSKWNDIVGNDITYNTWGVFLDIQTDGHKIYHNNFINNTNQSYDGRSNENQWHNGYPNGGNYWSDYTGVDNFKGPGQNVSGSDGIGDTPYNFDPNTNDTYPLMKPFGTPADYTILKQGWNLISVPLVQQDQAFSEVLYSINGYYDAVQWQDITDIGDPWKHNKVGKSFGNDLFELNETMGFWIHINQPGDTIYRYNGTQPISNQFIPLHPGWNLVGFPSLSNKDRTAALNNLVFDTHVDAIWTFNASSQNWEELDESTDYFELCRGYWIHATQECVWEVPL